MHNSAVFWTNSRSLGGRRSGVYESGHERDLVVVGGGLAGLSAAYYGAVRGQRVSVIERRNTLGGRARSLPKVRTFNPFTPEDLSAFRPSMDKGYHVFPGWYDETWKLIEAVGATDRFFPRTRQTASPPQAVSYRYVQRGPKGDAPTFRPMAYLGMSSEQLRDVVDLVAVSIDLATHTRRSIIDASVPEFISSRPYVSDKQAIHLRNVIIRALGNTSENPSADSLQSMLRRWLPGLARHNNWVAPRGSLQYSLIEPITERCRELGVEFVTGEVSNLDVANGEVRSVSLRDGRSIDTSEKNVILAVPSNVSAGLVGAHEDLAEAAGRDAMRNIRMGSVGAIDLYFRSGEECHRLPRHLLDSEFPSEHFVLNDSAYGLTGFKISDLADWKAELDGAPGLVVQFVIGDMSQLSGMDEHEIARVAIEEIATFLRFDPAEHLYACAVHDGAGDPCTHSDSDTWKHRPRSRVEGFANLILAGDHVRTRVNVASMEAAVESGHNAVSAQFTDVSASPEMPEGEIPDGAIGAAAIGLAAMILASPVTRRIVGSAAGVSKEFAARHQRLAEFAGLASPLLGGATALYLPRFLDDYSHARDAVSRLGFEPATAGRYRASTIVCATLNLAFAAATEGNGRPQNVAAGIRTAGLSWAAVGLLPTAPPSQSSLFGRAGGVAGRMSSALHLMAALRLSGLLVAIPWRAARGENASPSDGVAAVGSAASAMSFAASLMNPGSIAPAVAQRIHMTTGHVWFVREALKYLRSN